MSEDEREDGKLPGSFKAPDCAQLNKLLPAFKFLELIACGGMGAVYRARQLSLGRDVAIKVLPPEISAAGSVFVESFKTEARTMASLSHPNLVGIHDFGEVSGMLYLVMEYIDGNALYRSIKGQKVKPVQAVEIVEEVARGLGEAHERGLLHRDIKPANILLTSKRKPVLGDFGLVVRSDAVGSGLNMGTPGYTAPEVVRDFEAASTSSDVYALGMILHEMLSGVMPTGEHAPDLSLVPDMNGLRRLVGRVVSSDPSQRPADGEALAGELASWLERAQRMKGLVLTPAATVARPAQPIVRSPGVGRKKGLVLSPRAPLLTPTAGNSEAPAPVAAPQAQVAIGPNWSLLRNLIIIVLLIGAIYGMTRAYKWQKQNIAKQDPQPEQVIPGPRKQPSPPAPVAKPSPAVVEPPQPKVSDFKWAVNDRKATIKAAEQGNANAQNNLGGCYAKGNGVAKDATEAMKWFRKAAEQGYALAQYNLGVCCENGLGVAKDATEAVKWWRKAAEQGLAEAQYNLGVCYDKGEGVAKDYTEAVKWYRKAAEQGQANAQNNLGGCYEDGEGVAKDDVIAYMWLNLAAASGNENAKHNRKILEKRMTGDQIAGAQRLSRKWKRRGEGNGKNGKKETAQERINRIARETTEKMGIDLERAKKDAVMPAVFGAGDGARIRSWMGETVTLEAKLFRARDSKSGKTRYLEFSEEIGADVIAVRCWPSDEFALEGLKALEGKKVRFKGRAEQERGTGRVVVHLETRSQIEEVESGPEAR